MTTFDDLADEGFISLTTFRKTGVGVPTTVWVGRDGDALLVTTPARQRQGQAAAPGPARRDVAEQPAGEGRRRRADRSGVAEVLDDDAARERCNEIMQEKYGLEYRVMMGIEKLGRKGDDNRVILRITPA